jgi:hypothetical protein
MKKKHFLSATLVMVLALSFAFISCDDGSNDSGGGASTDGRLTITDLSAYNGQFISKNTQ